MTLLTLMCSQILIVNTKGLTRDISDILEMFQEIPGCAFDMEDFMIVKEKDVHLLENAFSCSFDDFNPQFMITNNDSFHFPVKTFPLKISNLREELLTLALIPSENHESQNFKNMHGFIAHMQSIWKEIDARGNFLHFKNSKDIQQWNAMKKIVSSYEETLLESYKVAGLKLIDERTELNQWTKNDDIMFEKCLDQETNNYLSQALADFQLKVSNQYNSKIIDVESQLIKLAKDKIGEVVGKILKENKDKTPEDFEKIFSKSKQEDHQTFMLTMIMETKKLEEHVVQFFNQAIENGTSKISDKNKPREKFNRRFWNTLVKPATLVKSDPLDDPQFLECIKIKGQALFGKVKDVLEYTTGYQTSKKKQAKEYLNNYNKPQDNFTIEIDNFCYAEQYLCLQVFIILEENTTRWKQKQQENLKKLNDEMLILFHNILSNSTYENISYQFYKYISQVVKEKLDAQGDIISEILERYIETKLIFDKNPTRVAYEKSFGSYDVSKYHQYVDCPTSFMRLLFEDNLEAFKDIKIDMLIEDIEKAIFTSWKEFEKYIASWEQHFLSSQNITLKQILQRADGMAMEGLVENVSHLLGKCVIKSPVEFFVVLKAEHNKSLVTFTKHWKENGIFNCKESLRIQISNNKDYYWYKAEGCTHRCPLCGSKCELAKHDSGTHHVASFHLMVCFSGWRNSNTHIAVLEICNPANDQLMQVRAMWMHLKDELYKKWDMKDVTPENRFNTYYHLFK
ncbi:4890_t:CDS:10 [Gigaspora margarita]|uniref:4890_t:CDS:1 n=1 Tax=Gigaspora margarita TaxID=4874 RepID=A0ABN7VN95_GIGMA|nr:4890_t:CDS:10 [Gigaspora margarita]